MSRWPKQPVFLFLLGFSLPSDVAYKARTLFGVGHPFGKRSVSSYKDARPSLSSDDTLARSDRCTYSNSIRNRYLTRDRGLFSIPYL